MNYFILTIDRQEGDGLETVWTISSNISNFILIEKELGRNTVILYSREISKEEYDSAQNVLKKLKK